MGLRSRRNHNKVAILSSSVEPFAAVEIIAAKRDRNELTDTQIDWVVDAYTRGVVADEQMSALLMAILLNGMNSREISREFIPLSRIAISRADICSSATTPRV